MDIAITVCKSEILNWLFTQTLYDRRLYKSAWVFFTIINEALQPMPIKLVFYTSIGDRWLHHFVSDSLWHLNAAWRGTFCIKEIMIVNLWVKYKQAEIVFNAFNWYSSWLVGIISLFYVKSGLLINNVRFSENIFYYLSVCHRRNNITRTV